MNMENLFPHFVVDWSTLGAISLAITHYLKRLLGKSIGEGDG